MCPGGFVVGATSEEGRVVTNGMSQHSRKERNANSGLVVALDADDLAQFERFPGDPLAGIALQRELEERAFKLGETVMPHRRSGWRISWLPVPPPVWVASSRPISRVCIPPIWMTCSPLPSLRPCGRRCPPLLAS